MEAYSRLASGSIADFAVLLETATQRFQLEPSLKSWARMERARIALRKARGW